MKDNLEKYYRLSMDFANKAGWLMQNYEQQLRLCNKLSKERLSDDQKKLILSCLETHQVAADLCNYTKNFLQEIVKDYDVLIDAAKTRNIIEEQSEIISHYIDNDYSSHILRKYSHRLKDNSKVVS
jgi:hypothetical protein